VTAKDAKGETGSAPPLALETFGSFYVGGRRIEVSGEPAQVVSLSADLPAYHVDANGTYSVEAAYVQYSIPAAAKDVAVVLVHGGGLTGACWETTPDGRDGWYPALARAGWPTYVVDTVERGRAGWCPLPGYTDSQPLLRSEEESWAVFRIGPAERYAARETFPGSLFPVAALPELTRQQVPRWTTTTDASVAALTELARRLGRCVLVGHSQGGGIAARAAREAAGAVVGLVLLEPHGLPEPDGTAEPVPQLLVSGDYLLETNLYRELESRWLEYRQNTVVAGATVDRLDLPREGLGGNSHMLMMDLNSDVVARLVQQWIDDRVRLG
jgi:pimeloyl-ACP methyl ester carboxylesterase